MKALMILAFAVFTVCQANPTNQRKQNPHLENLINAFWNYVAQTAHTTDETPQLGQGDNITQTPPTDDLMTRMTKETEVMRERLNQDLINVRDKLEPYADNLKSQIQQRVEELRAAMAPYADSLDSESLKATLLQKSEELRGNLEQSVNDLQAQLVPYTAELKENVDQYLQEMKKYFSAKPEYLQDEIYSNL